MALQLKYFFWAPRESQSKITGGAWPVWVSKVEPSQKRPNETTQMKKKLVWPLNFNFYFGSCFSFTLPEPDSFTWNKLIIIQASSYCLAPAEDTSQGSILGSDVCFATNTLLAPAEFENFYEVVKSCGHRMLCLFLLKYSCFRLIANLGLFGFGFGFSLRELEDLFFNFAGN